MKLPEGARYHFQMQYGSIGWATGATLGVALAVGEKTALIEAFEIDALLVHLLFYLSSICNSISHKRFKFLLLDRSLTELFISI